MTFKKDVENFFSLLQKDGIFYALKVTCNVCLNRVGRPIYRLYNSVKGIFTSKVIQNPYQVVEVPVDELKYSISPTPHTQLGWLGNKIKPCLPEDEKVRKIDKEGKNIFLKRRIVGKIASGDWDLKKVKFEEEINHVAFKQRFLEGKDWEDTVYFDWFEKRCREKEEPRENSKSFEEFKQNFLYKWDSLYKGIEEKGYCSQKDISVAKSVKTHTGKLEEGNCVNEVQIGISRKGELLFIEGRHRLSIAKILNIEKIPAIVNVWHKKYTDWLKNDIGMQFITPKNAINAILEEKNVK